MPIYDCMAHESFQDIKVPCCACNESPEVYMFDVWQVLFAHNQWWASLR
jgi:hypothetical protein